MKHILRTNDDHPNPRCVSTPGRPAMRTIDRITEYRARLSARATPDASPLIRLRALVVEAGGE